MFFQVSIVVLLVATLSINAEETTSCDKTVAYDAIKSMRKEMQIARATNRTEAFNLYNAMTSFESASDVIKNVIENCPENDAKQFKAMLRLVFGLITGNLEQITPSLKSIEDKQLLEEFIGLLYSIDEGLIAMFMISAPPEISLPLSNAFINLLERTNLNNTEVIPTIKLINRLNEELKEAKQEMIIDNLKNILRHAIKVDLILQYDNIEELYKINEELTKEVIKELVTIYATQEIESHDQLALFPLFLIIKCSSNSDIWVDNLNLVLETLKSSDNLISIQTLMLLKEVDGLLEGAPENKVLLNIKSQIPDSMEKVLHGNICVKSEEINKPMNVFMISSNGFKVMSFKPNEQGSNILMMDSAGNFNFTIVVNFVEEIPNFTESNTIQTQVGDLEKITEEEYCNKKQNIAFHGCVDVAKVLPTGGARVLHLGFVKQMARYTDLIMLDVFAESCVENNNDS